MWGEVPGEGRKDRTPRPGLEEVVTPQLLVQEDRGEGARPSLRNMEKEGDICWYPRIGGGQHPTRAIPQIP